MRNNYADFNLLAVSAGSKETALNTPQTLDTLLLVEKSNLLGWTPRREHNGDLLTGKEEPDSVLAMGGLSEGTLNFPKAEAQHFAFGYANALGSVATAAAGSAGKLHTITPVSGELPGLTAGQRLGADVVKQRFSSLFLDSLTASFQRDSFASLNLGLKGTGLVEENVTKETVSELDDASSLDVSTAVHGDDVDNIHGVTAVLVTGETVDVVVTSVSGTTINITSVGGAGVSITYYVLYVPTEPAWCTFPSRVIEPPLRVANMQVLLNASYDGSAITGGHDIASQLKGLEHTVTNGIEQIFSPGGTGEYADEMRRAAREQKLTVNKEFRDYLLQQHLRENAELVVYVLLAYEANGIEAGHTYQVELIFPKVGILAAPITVDGRVHAEAGDLQVLEDTTHGSVIAKVKNKVAAYAA